MPRCKFYKQNQIVILGNKYFCIQFTCIREALRNQQNYKVIYYQVYMSRAETNKQVNDNLEVPLMKINQVINSIFAMNQPTILDQLQICSKIVSQLLQNQLISHINSIGAVKLLCYQLVLMIAEQSTAQSKPRLSLLENAFGNNRKLKLTASMRNTLASINQVLDQIVWKNLPKKRVGTQKNLNERTAIQQNYAQFKQLLQQFDRELDSNETQRNDEVHPKFKKKPNGGQSSDSEENEALIQQLEEIVAKKQRRIKQLNQELQQNILEQKAQEDLITQLQSRNIDLKEEIRLLNTKLGERDANQIQLQQKIQQLKAQNIIQERQVYSKKPIMKTQKTIKNRFNLHDEFEDEVSMTAKKQLRDLFEEKEKQKNTVCLQCQAKKDINLQDFNGLRRMLFIQAVSIEALI